MSEQSEDKVFGVTQKQFEKINDAFGENDKNEKIIRNLIKRVDGGDITNTQLKSLLSDIAENSQNAHLAIFSFSQEIGYEGRSVKDIS